ncbi:MAG: hypothetical protein L3J79_04295 [Candidatus Marinimicrobia bacterium]|nr:hypothetical protein [Candidatus Neomarinimicrobiota bacterium]
MTSIKQEQLIIREERLANGLQIIFSDESNRYFGDYHRICIAATIVCDLNDLLIENSDDVSFFRPAIEKLGEQLTVVKHFKRMGVATADVETVRTELIDSFLQHAGSYLSRPEYPLALVNAELKKRSTHCYYP